jgi:hypothetical protein
MGYVPGITSNGKFAAGITGDGVLTQTGVELGKLTVGTGANNIVQLDASSRLPAIDATQLLDVPSGCAHFKPLSGAYMSSQPFNNGEGTSALVPDTMHLMLVTFRRNVTISEMRTYVTTAAAGNMKFIIYDSNSNRLPNSVLLESAAVDTSTTGVKDVILSPNFVFESGKIYWLGAWGNTSASVRTINRGGTQSIGIVNSAGNSVAGCFERPLVYGVDSLPDPFNATVADMSNTLPIAPRLKVA